MVFVYHCPYCRKTYNSDPPDTKYPAQTIKCPSCSHKLVYAGHSQETWDDLSHEEKDDKYAELQKKELGPSVSKFGALLIILGIATPIVQCAVASGVYSKYGAGAPPTDYASILSGVALAIIGLAFCLVYRARREKKQRQFSNELTDRNVRPHESEEEPSDGTAPEIHDAKVTHGPVTEDDGIKRKPPASFFKWAFFSCIAVIVAMLAAYVIARRNASDDEYKAGYEAGYDIGYEEAKTEWFDWGEKYGRQAQELLDGNTYEKGYKAGWDAYPKMDEQLFEYYNACYDYWEKPANTFQDSR